jgi:hypothetical protein
VTTGPPDAQGVPIPPEDTSQAYARRVWRNVRALLIASCVVGAGVISILLLLGYWLAGVAGVTLGAVIAVGGLVLLAGRLLTY